MDMRNWNVDKSQLEWQQQELKNKMTFSYVGHGPGTRILTSLWIWIPFVRHCTTGWNMIKETDRDVAVLLRQCLRHPEWD